MKLFSEYIISPYGNTLSQVKYAIWSRLVYIFYLCEFLCSYCIDVHFMCVYHATFWHNK